MKQNRKISKIIFSRLLGIRLFLRIGLLKTNKAHENSILGNDLHQNFRLKRNLPKKNGLLCSEKIFFSPKKEFSNHRGIIFSFSFKFINYWKFFNAIFKFFYLNGPENNLVNSSSRINFKTGLKEIINFHKIRNCLKIKKKGGNFKIVRKLKFKDNSQKNDFPESLNYIKEEKLLKIMNNVLYSRKIAGFSKIVFQTITSRINSFTKNLILNLFDSHSRRKNYKRIGKIWGNSFEILDKSTKSFTRYTPKTENQKKNLFKKKFLKQIIRPVFYDKKSKATYSNDSTDNVTQKFYSFSKENRELNNKANSTLMALLGGILRKRIFLLQKATETISKYKPFSKKMEMSKRVVSQTPVKEIVKKENKTVGRTSKVKNLNKIKMKDLDGILWNII